jgi:chromosome segregation ATPase
MTDAAIAITSEDMVEDPRLAIGGNAPPSDIEILSTKLDEENLDLLAKKIECEAEIKHIPDVIEDEAQAAKLTDWLRKAKGVVSALDERRKSRKRPFDDLAKTVQTFFLKLINPLDQSIEDLKPRLTAYQKVKEEAARQRALEEQRKREAKEKELRDEADRKAREAAEAEEKARVAREAEAKAKRERDEAEVRAKDEQRKAAEAEVARKEAERVAKEEKRKADEAREERERAEKKAAEEQARADEQRKKAEAAQAEAEESDRKRKAAEKAQAEAEERERKAKEREAEAERLRQEEKAREEEAARARAAADAARETAGLAQQSADTAETAVDAAADSAKAHGVVATLNEKAAARGLKDAIKTDGEADREEAAGDRAARRYMAKPSELSNVHGEFNSLAVSQRAWVFTPIDRQALDLEALRSHLPMDALEQAVRSFIEAGGRTLRGTLIIEDRETHIR